MPPLVQSFVKTGQFAVILGLLAVLLIFSHNYFAEGIKLEKLNYITHLSQDITACGELHKQDTLQQAISPQSRLEAVYASFHEGTFCANLYHFSSNCCYGTKLEFLIITQEQDYTIQLIRHRETPGIGTRVLDVLGIENLLASNFFPEDAATGATITAEGMKKALGEVTHWLREFQTTSPSKAH